MAEQVREKHQYRYSEEEHREQLAKDVKLQKAQRKAGELSVPEIDDILEAIDEVIEVNAVEMARTYVQAGGE